MIAVAVAVLVTLDAGVAGASGWPGLVVAATPAGETAALSAIDCTSATSCVAVGELNLHGALYPWIVTESGGTWDRGSFVQAPSDGTTHPLVQLKSVSCTAAGDCVAVGTYARSLSGGGVTEAGVIFEERGGVWGSGVEAPIPGDATDTESFALNAVSCPSSGPCLAVGGYHSQSDSWGYLVTESGGGWTAVTATAPSDEVADGGAELVGASCPSSDSCAAVGNYYGPSGEESWLTTESSGLWSNVPVQLPSDASTYTDTYGLEYTSDLDGISCPSATSCVVSGQYWNKAGPQGLVASEDAGSWGVGAGVSAPAGASADPDASLSSIACTSSTACSAVGTYSAAAGSEGQTVSESAGVWGAASEAALPPDAGTNPFAGMSSITCVSQAACSAVGYDETSALQAEAFIASTQDESPSSPTIQHASLATTSVTLKLTAPLTDGGSAVRTYQYSLNAGKSWTTRKAGTTSTTMQITKLRARTTYKLAVRAVNKVGPGTGSLVAKVTTR